MATKAVHPSTINNKLTAVLNEIGVLLAQDKKSDNLQKRANLLKQLDDKNRQIKFLEELGKRNQAIIAKFINTRIQTIETYITDRIKTGGYNSKVAKIRDSRGYDSLKITITYHPAATPVALPLPGMEKPKRRKHKKLETLNILFSVIIPSDRMIFGEDGTIGCHCFAETMICDDSTAKYYSRRDFGLSRDVQTHDSDSEDTDSIEDQVFYVRDLEEFDVILKYFDSLYGKIK